ncbi:MAG TPA: FtsX-like permease family protein [Solirubrobacteraceae bacterium]|nr:FtsX-like permease family protein [Solirubrobacteraceae bacterium]
MKLSSILRLYRVRLRARLTQELFAVLGIAIGVALLFASQVANTSLDGSVQRLNDGIVGQMRFELASRDNSGFDERLLGEVTRLPGVQAAAPVVEQNANVVGPTGQRSVDLVGTDPRLARLGGSIARHVGALRLAGGARVFTLPIKLAKEVGVVSIRPVEVQVGARSEHVLLIPRFADIGASGLGGSPIGLASLRTVQRIAGMQGRLTSIYVRTGSRTAAEVHAGLERLSGGRLNVRPADSTSRLFRRAAGPVNQSTALFSALSALVGFLFAFNALLLTVPQRRSLIEDLRLDGYTRRMIVEILLLDALVLGVLASLLGLVLGEVVSAALFNSDPEYLSFAFPIGSERVLTVGSILIALLGGILAAAAGVLMPLRSAILERPTKTTPLTSRISPRSSLALLGVAVACLGVTTAILLAAPSSAIVGVVSLTFALLLCLPALLDLAVLAAERLQNLSRGAAPHVALIELRSRNTRVRSLAIAATGAIAVFGSVSIQGARDGLQRGLDTSARTIDSAADIWVTAAGASNALATTPFDDVASAKLRLLPGVNSVRLYRGSFLDWGDRRVWTLAQPRVSSPPISASEIVGGDAKTAFARLRQHGWVILSRALAASHDLHLGQSFSFPTPQPSAFRIAALSTNLGWPPGAMVLNADDYARAWASGRPSAYQITLSRGASAAVVSREVSDTLGPDSGLRTETKGQRERLQYASASQGLSRLTQIRSLVLIAAVLAMAAAMGAMIWQRRRRLADMKVDGFSRAVLWRALLWESVILLGVGCALGAAFGAFGQLLLSRALSVVTGFPVIESTPILGAIANFALITAVAVAIVAVPGYAAARVRPAVGLQE